MLLTVTAKEKPHVTLQKAESEHPGTPAIRGPKLPEAVRRMLPKGPLGRRMIGNLKVYSGPTHPHQAQQPTELTIS